MEKLVIFRLFLCFPLFGFLLPEAGFLLSKKPINIPLGHLIVEATLTLMVIACSVMISVLKKRENNSTDTNETPAYKL